MTDNHTRIAIINEAKCKPSKCKQECKKKCPVIQMGKQCIEVTSTNKICFISEELCIGCGGCVKQCPFDAITIINLPKSLDNQITHRYDSNSFKLHRLPIPKQGKVLGLVGSNGLGKSTIMKILAGKLIPNLGNYDNVASISNIITHYRGSELQSYFTKLYNDEIKSLVKPQYVDAIPNIIKGNIQDILRSKCTNEDKLDRVLTQLDLKHILNRDIKVLSGGDLQRFAIAMIMVQESDIYMFDEPSSYLDIKQRLRAADLIRSLTNDDKYVVCIEHDLSILDYLSDNVSCLYGTSSAYGVVTTPFSIKEGINVFLSGFIPTENLRFRDNELDFNASYISDTIIDNAKIKTYYPAMSKTLSDDKNSFTLDIEGGYFSTGELVVLIGENAMGKSTFIKILAGIIKTDTFDMPKLNVSYIINQLRLINLAELNQVL